MIFRRQAPGLRVERGLWTIRRPPYIVLAPPVGWEPAVYRPGCGAGCPGRMLAAPAPLPVAIGVGPQSARLATITPQPHDVAMDAIATEEGVRLRCGLQRPAGGPSPHTQPGRRFSVRLLPRPFRGQLPFRLPPVSPRQ
jgi:hypothetical protein